ncbi:hypothetical protein Prudu_003378 [Prunus dulcis]|uniref:Uncharacterized protein n=1 Tax=Prunus dulcis TaxID=3755 RepID=A0A4Y1QT48_PRUDU|nr:hypothetical protein Prudu_003378 [Prunus dulcis]
MQIPQLGGYYIPAGTEVCINRYGCNMDKNQGESPEEWKHTKLDSDKHFSITRQTTSQMPVLSLIETALPNGIAPNAKRESLSACVFSINHRANKTPKSEPYHLHALWGLIFAQKKGYAKLPPVPVVPGLPLIGNLLQLKEKKPYKTFTKWGETYGPIYSIRTGASTLVVLNSTDVAKEALVTRHSSISSRKLSTTALKILTFDNALVAASDYNDFHKMGRRHMVTNVLGSNAQS